MSLTNECMTVNLHIGQWGGYRFDKEQTRKVLESTGASDGAARVNKSLVDKAQLKPVTSAANAIRTHFYRYTLPWKDNGDRLLTRKAYPEFIQEHEDLKAKFVDEVEHFLTDVYPREIDRAEFRMGDMFDPDDFPSADKLRHRFYADLEIDVVSEAKDFRVDIEKGEAERVKSQIESGIQRRINDAMGDLWSRLSEAKDLRKDGAVRKHAATEADRIMTEMEGLMKAFGAAA